MGLMLIEIDMSMQRCKSTGLLLGIEMTKEGNEWRGDGSRGKDWLVFHWLSLASIYVHFQQCPMP